MPFPVHSPFSAALIQAFPLALQDATPPALSCLRASSFSAAVLCVIGLNAVAQHL